MEEREGFVKDSKTAVKGVLNGIIGSSIYEIIISLIITFFITFIVSGNNQGASVEEMQGLINDAYNSFPYSILITCLSSLVTLFVFVFIIKKDAFVKLCKKAINVQTLKYGVLGAFCIMFFSIVYNNSIMIIFELEDGANANQEAVTSLIKNNVFLGLLSVVVLAPIVEELTFRYSLFGGVVKKNKWVAYFASALVFMFMHSIASFSQAGGLNNEFLKELIYLPPYLFSGLALCYVYDKCDNVGSSVIAHMLNNLVSFLIVVLL